MAEERTYPEDFNDWTEEDWADFLLGPYSDGPDENDIDDYAYNYLPDPFEAPDPEELFGEPPAIDWHYDDSGYYAYITLNGPREVVEDFKDVLARNGFLVPLYGRSNRPASDGRQYNWYIRVATPEGKPQRADLVELFGVPLSEVERDAGPSAKELQKRLTETVAEKASLEKRYRTAQETVSELEAKIQTLQFTYERTRNNNTRLTQQVASLKERIESLEEERGDLYDKINYYSDRSRIAELNQARLASQNESVAELQHRINELEDERSQAKQQLSFLEDKLRAVQGDLRDVQKELDENEQLFNDLSSLYDEARRTKEELRDQLATAINERDTARWERDNAVRAQHEPQEATAALDHRKGRSAWSGPMSKETIGQLMALFTPNIEYLNGSLDFIAMEVQDPTELFEQLYDIDRGNLRTDGERVKGTKDWMELRCQTGGRRRPGRVYYNRKATADGKTLVLVSHKKTQSTDFKRLRRI